MRDSNSAVSVTLAILSVAGMVLAWAPSGMAQTTPAQPQAGQNCSAPGGAATKAEPATQPNTASADGTAPGNSGSTGWTGGTGGAYIGNNPQGATQNSPNWQPPTARGLDLTMKADPAPAAATSVGC